MILYYICIAITWIVLIVICAYYQKALMQAKELNKVKKILCDSAYEIKELKIYENVMEMLAQLMRINNYEEKASRDYVLRNKLNDYTSEYAQKIRTIRDSKSDE